MRDEGDEAVEMLLRMIQKRVEAHRVEKHEHVAEEDRERMPDEQVPAALVRGGLVELLLGHDGIRPDLRAPELGVVVVMVVVRAAPDAARAERQDADNPHENLRQPRLGQDRVVLLIVVNDEQPQNQKPGQHTASHASQRVEIPKRPRLRGQQQE